MPRVWSEPFLRATAVVLCLLFSLPVASRADSELLSNRGFETCTFSGWSVGGLATSGVDVDGTAITGTTIANNAVNVRNGSCAAWAKVARASGVHFVLSQTVSVRADTYYTASFWSGLAGDSDVGRYATIEVDGDAVFDDFYSGVIGSTSSDFVQVGGSWYSGATSGPVTVTFTLEGSGTGLAGLSYDDFSFAAVNRFANPGFETCDFTGWGIGGSAESGVDVDGTALSGTIIGNNVVNVRSGSCAAWAKEANFEGIDLVLSQTVEVTPGTDYRVSFWAGLAGDSNAGRHATIEVGASTLFDDNYGGVIGTTPADFVKVGGSWNSGATSGPVTVTFTLTGSGSGLAGFSYDDFSFLPAAIFADGFESMDTSRWSFAPP